VYMASASKNPVLRCQGVSDESVCYVSDLQSSKEYVVVSLGDILAGTYCAQPTSRLKIRLQSVADAVQGLYLGLFRNRIGGPNGQYMKTPPPPCTDRKRSSLM
jgi:hypothetical protein